MMDEIKQLIEMIAKLPQLAIWVLVAFWAYKVIVIGSVYGVIRFVVEKVHSWLVTPKHDLIKQEVRLLVDGEVISGAKDSLMAQLQRVKKRTGIYIHQTDVDWLRDAISEKLQREGVEARP